MEKAKKRVRPGNIVLLAITIILAFLFIYPVFGFSDGGVGNFDSLYCSHGGLRH